MEEKVNILIVDDDEDTCWNLAQVFGRMGYETESARTGKETLEKAKEKFFNLTLLDIKLPDMEGIELIAPLKEIHPDMALIIVTGYASLKTAVLALNNGASGYITKPLDMDEMLSKVRDILEMQRLVIENRGLYQKAQKELTERKQAEEALLKAAEEWRYCFDALNEMMLLIDSNFRVQRVNKATARILGRKMGKILGQPCYRLIHGTESPPDYCPHVQVITTASPHNVEIEEPYLGRILDISVSPVMNKKGCIDRIVEIIDDVTDRRHQEQKTIRLTQTLAESFKGTTEAITELVESRDPYTVGHSKGVAELATRIAQEMGMEKEEIQGIWVCAMLHDVGKAVIPSDVLNKPGELSDNELGIIKEHPKKSYDILLRIPFPWPVAEVVYQHHERLDGSGYPRGLKGDEIHIWARILAAADVLDAMTNHRPYRPALRLQDAINEIERARGTLYEEQVVDACAGLLSQGTNRVMVVDDDSKVLQVFIRSLHHAGLKVEGFEDPRLALQAFEKRPFPVVITDLKMPGMDGLDLSGKVKEIHPATKVIVITGFGEKKHSVEALRLGVSDFLDKPLDPETVRAAVETALRHYQEENLIGLK